MNFTATTKPLSEISSDALVVFLKQDETPQEKALDKICGGNIRRLRASKDFLGESSKVRILFNQGSFPRVLLVGVGKNEQLTLEKLREAGSIATQTLKSLPVTRVSVVLPQIPKAVPADTAQTIAESLILSAYEFPYYKTSKKDKPKFEDIEIVATAKEKHEIEKGLVVGRIIANAVIESRDLGNHPANVATPEHLAKHARALSKELPQIKARILGRDEIAKEKMGGLLGVSQGSDQEPKFIILEYFTKKSAPTIVLVGKGLTFDSGGISIKPPEKMDEMKFDMSGGADVMGVLKAACQLKLPFNLIGLIPSTENLPSGKAVKPGDIIQTRSGKTVEVVNTDAEGRLILSDGLDYAKKYDPDLVIDYATLTGSIVVALGDDIIGAFTNTEKLATQMQAAAKITGEKLWPMPLDKDYELFIKSEFADLRNQSTIRYGDAIHAANFLSNFVDYPWVHLDIAGVAWTTREKPYRPKGATGTGIRLTIEFLKKFKR